MNLCFQKEKTLRKCVFTTTVIHVYFAPLFPPTCKFAFIQRILLEAKVLPLISQVLAFWGSLFIIILTINIF